MTRRSTPISTCVKGKFGWDFVNSEERITTPLIRQGDAFVEATWDEALSLVAERLGGIKRIRFQCARLHLVLQNHERRNYVIRKAGAPGVRNEQYRQLLPLLPVASASDGLMSTVGIGGDAGSIKDIASAGLVILIGCAPAEGHPVLATRIKRAHKLHGQKLIVADLRKHEMAERSDLFIRPKQGTDFVWLSAVTKYMIDQGWHDEAFVQQHVHQFGEYKQLLEKFTLEFAEQENRHLQRDAHFDRDHDP
ncbi:molybdopterin-dependent oxidoreductase [Paenibacillus sp. JTLBN-2024]